MEDERTLAATESRQQGVSLMAAKQYREAKACFERSISADPRSAETYMNLGYACANLEQLDEARQAFEKVLYTQPDNGEALFNIGNVCLLQDDYLHCVEFYNRAEEKGFKRAELYSSLSAVYRRQGNAVQALRCLTRAIDCAPFDGRLRVEKAAIQIDDGCFDEAAETLEELLRVIPDAFEAYDLQTQIWLGKKEYDKALACIEKGVKRFPHDAALLLIKIKVLIEMKRLDEAEAAIESAKSLDDYPKLERDYLVQQATVCATRSDQAGARQALESALALENGAVDEQVRYLLMNLCFYAQDYARVAELGQSLSDTGSNDLFCISGKFYHAFALEKLGRHDDSQREFRTLAAFLRRLTIETPSLYEAYVYRVLCHKELGEYDKALELADFIGGLFPDKADAHALRYAIYTASGDEEKAQEERRLAKAANMLLQL